ncbi:hypothetical protein B0H14DRAFT_3567085 [Mycena olivaceomarginata]|nr:hypothetical protein B0H14DRAFT_3567085 [Mycena olivaceomarginata]
MSSPAWTIQDRISFILFSTPNNSVVGTDVFFNAPDSFNFNPVPYRITEADVAPTPGCPFLMVYPAEHGFSTTQTSVQSWLPFYFLVHPVIYQLLPFIQVPVHIAHMDHSLMSPCTLVLKIDGCNISILHGKLVGILALTLSNPKVPSTLYTDHLNSVRIIDDSKTIIDQALRLRTLNGCSYYRWILALSTNNPLRITYTPRHSDEVSFPAHLNYEADHYASSAQCQPREIIPTFFMAEYTFYSHTDGWIESNITTYLHKSRSLSMSRAPASGHQLPMALHL